MQYSISEVLTLTIVAMLAVFAILTGLMLLMLLLGRLFGKTAETPELPQTPMATQRALTPAELFEQDPLAKVAALTALAQASEEADGRRFQIEMIERIE